jgi:Rrf2 family transcriptional regulator, nitric oxide-sensitive transcriptional repressor
MQLNLKTDYSLRLLLFLAVHPEEVVPVGRVAKVFGVSSHHLAKVAQTLTDYGFLAVQRGRGGGISLALNPSQISLSEVVRKVEGSLSLVECFDPKTNTCVIAPVCGLKKILHEAQVAFFAVLGKYTLADLVKNPAVLRALLHQQEALQRGV